MKQSEIDRSFWACTTLYQSSAATAHNDMDDSTEF